MYYPNPLTLLGRDGVLRAGYNAWHALGTNNPPGGGDCLIRTPYFEPTYRYWPSPNMYHPSLSQSSKKME